MKGKKIVLILAVALALVIPFSVYAATSDSMAAKKVRGFFGIDISKLDGKQKADVDDYTKKLAELQKDFINKMEANGALTSEQAQAEIKRIDEMQTSGYVPGFGGPGRQGGPDVRGGRGKPGMNKLDTSKLTDEQKASLKETYSKMADLHKSLIEKMVSDGLLTRAQADAALEKMNAINAAAGDKAFSGGMGLFGGFGPFPGPQFMDQSKLTEQQKADLNDYSAKMAELRKEAVDKLVSYGVITESEGASMLDRLQNMENFRNQKGFERGGGMMRKSRPDGSKVQGGASQQS